MTNYFLLPGSQEHNDADCQISDDESLVHRWHQSLMSCSVRPSHGNSRFHPSGRDMTTFSLPFLSLLFNYPQLSLFFFVSSRRTRTKNNRLLPRCMQIFAQTPLSRWEMWEWKWGVIGDRCWRDGSSETDQWAKTRMPPLIGSGIKMTNSLFPFHLFVQLYFS